jgi:hypothetical protein
MPHRPFTTAGSAGLLGLLLACTHNVAPKVTPSKIAAVKPPIHARAILLITPSFETYTSESSQGIHKYNYHLGQSAAAALKDLVTGSFDQAETQQVSEAEGIQWLSAAPDTGRADLILIPHFETGGASQRLLDIVAEVRLRMDIRSLRAGTTQSLTAAGRTARAMSSLRGLTGSALEQALSNLSDSLSAHRSELEVTATASR